MNVVALIGRMTRDPELKTVTVGGEDRSVCNFRLAVARNRGSDEADYVNIECWGKGGEQVAQYGRTGRLVSVEGSLRHSEKADEVERREFYSVRAHNVRFLDPAGSGRTDGEGASSADGADDGFVDERPPAPDFDGVF